MAENKNKPVNIKTNDDLFDFVISEFCPKQPYEEGNYEHNLRTVAIGCNYAGIAKEEAVRLIRERYGEKYDVDESFVRQIVEQVYEELVNDFARSTIMVSLKMRNKFDDEDWQKLPYIPDEVFKHLPDILKRGSDKFANKRERDVFLTGAIGVISGLLTNVHGIYQENKVYPNLFCFIVAPAGSGKGSLVFAKQMAMPIHNSTQQHNNAILIFIPANISSASINMQLNKNGGWGIIFESEADSLAGSFKQEWGNFSDLLRKAYHHEPIEMKRKDNDLYINVQEPKLSVILSGTLNQIRGIIKNTEDGLFSRFIFYTYRAEVLWKKYTETHISNNVFFEELGQELSNLVSLSALKDVEVRLSPNQLDIFNSRFENWMYDFALYMNDEALSIIKRHGLIFFRICMILTILRNAENQTQDEDNDLVLYCGDEDFKTAFMLIETYMHHAVFIFRLMHNDKEEVINTRLQMFYDRLPLIEFDRAIAVQVGVSHGIAPRTVDKYLKNLLRSKYLIQPNYGTYKKI